MRRQIDVGFSHRLLANCTALSELESSIIHISLLLELSTDSIAENSAGECNIVSTLDRVRSRNEAAAEPLDSSAAWSLI